MESFLKVPLILSSAIAVHVSFTPQTVPSMNEMIHQTFNEWVFTRLVTYGLPSMKNVIQYVVRQRIRVASITFPFMFGTALVVAGGLIRWWCYRTLGRFFTFQLSVRKGHHIVTTGPYAAIRHPSYTAGMMVVIGILVLHGSPTSWLRLSGILDIPGLKMVVVAWLAQMTLFVINVVCRVSQEDEILKSAF
ncbi:hypothetical protein EDB19DRAFT_1826000 [Suillus lakei]|nr:hypothetical protein EDB19DRAFT_1826000 [Suillus lakei]